MSALGPGAALVFPGDIDTPTGGYGYDRRLIAELPALGIPVEPVSLAGSFPHPAPGDISAALDRLAATPAGTVLIGDGLAFAALPAEALARLGRPLVGLVHHPLALESGLDARTAARLAAGETATLAACHRVIAVSPETRRVLVARFGVPAEKITLALPGTAPAPRASAAGDPPRLVAVGSLTPRKGYGVLLDAVALLGDLAFSLTIAGPESDPDTAAQVKAAIATLPEGRVRLAGPLDAAALDALYAQGDLFVHPSFYEGYGMVLAEAMRRGLPIVCTTGGAAGETVPDTAGLKVPPGDAKALAGALRRVISDAALRRELADGSASAGALLPSWTDTARIVADVIAAAKAQASP